MIIIRFITGVGGMALAGALVVLGIPAILLLWHAEEVGNRVPPLQSSCQFGAYNFAKHRHWRPIKNGRLPRLENPTLDGLGYAVKITLTDADADDHDLSYVPGVTLLPNGTPWEVPTADEQPYPGQDPDTTAASMFLVPGQSITVYEPMVYGTNSAQPPTGCSVSP